MINYQQRLREEVQSGLQEIQAEQNKSPEIASARRAVESARDLFEQERAGAATPETDPRWRHWNEAQRFSVRDQWGQRVETARQALELAEKNEQGTVASWSRAQLASKQEAEKIAREKEADQAQRAYAGEQEQTAKTTFRSQWLAAGGLPELFDTAWPGIWQEEVIRRAQGTSLVEKMRALPRYAGVI